MTTAPRWLSALVLISGCSDPLEVPGDAGPPNRGPPDAATEVGADVAPIEAGKELGPSYQPPDGPLACEWRVHEGPDLGVPDCPAAPPVEGTACQRLVGFAVCRYPGACDLDDWTCPAGKWTVMRGTCSTCPATEPAQGSSCAYLGDWRPSYVCTWPNSLGYSYGRCYNCHWELATSLRPAACPTDLPTNGDACASAGLECYYASPCHSTDRATCEQGKWQVKPGACY